MAAFVNKINQSTHVSTLNAFLRYIVRKMKMCDERFITKMTIFYKNIVILTRNTRHVEFYHA